MFEIGQPDIEVSIASIAPHRPADQASEAEAEILAPLGARA